MTSKEKMLNLINQVDEQECQKMLDTLTLHKVRYARGTLANMLRMAQTYADNNSTCRKTHVGCFLIAEDQWRTVLAKGTNHGEEDCRQVGCLREEVFGDNSKTHRATCRCAKCHSEIDALNNVAPVYKHKLKGATAIVTRYPCINCAKALVEAGITQIFWGREFPLEPETEAYLEEHNITYMHIRGVIQDENDKNN